MPANIELSALEMSLVTAMSREFTLRTYVNEAKKHYDVVLIDCMPSLGMITINALAAADSVIIPVQAHYLPAKGMTQLMKTINKVKRQINPALKVDGVLLTLVDGRTNLARQTADTLRQSYGSVLKIYRSEIPVAIKAAEISAAGNWFNLLMTVLHQQAEQNPYEEYREMAQKLIDQFMRYRRPFVDSDHAPCVALRMYPKEAGNTIWLLLLSLCNQYDPDKDYSAELKAAKKE